MQPIAAHAPRTPTLPHAAVSRAGSQAAELKIPEWVKDAVFYQVFPDRFANGDIGNDPPGTLKWGSAPTNDAFLGGDLAGVQQKLGYLGTLGVNALYFNPVFTSPSNHGYDITDYEHIEPRLGGDAAFTKLVDSAHDSGIRVMIDGVFNHTSHQHNWFRDVRDQGPASAHFGAYDVTSWPIRYTRDDKGVLRSPDYKSWWNYASLPELRTETPAVRDYLLTGKDSIAKRWIRDAHVDGWRMDVADEVEPDFWRVARREIKQVNPDAYMLAENWHDASSMLQGDQFDGAMNYKYFQQPAVDFFAQKKISADDFVARLASPYSREAGFGMFNVLDSHDTPRFITEAKGDWYRQRPAAIFQMTYVGAPVVYYGDEVGMEGAADPDSRRAFPWDRVNKALSHDVPADARPGGTPHITQPRAAKTAAPVPGTELFRLYQKLIDTRKREPALRRGDFQVLGTNNDHGIVTYRRFEPGVDRDAIVALNNDVAGHPVSIDLHSIATDGTAFVDALNGTHHVVQNGRIDIPHVDGNFGAVLLREPAAHDRLR